MTASPVSSPPNAHAAGGRAQRSARAQPEVRTVVQLIRQLQEGRIKGSSLAPSDRRRVVEHLTGEGYSSVEIAEIAGVSERTVERDRGAIKAQYALTVTPEFAGETIGHLIRQAEISVGRLRRMAKEKGAPASARVDAEYAAWRVQRELIAALQRLGCLPDVGIRADVTHHLGGELDPLEAAPALEELEAELSRLEAVQARTGGMPASVVERINQHRQAIGRLALSARLEAMRDAGPQRPVDPARRLT